MPGRAIGAPQPLLPASWFSPVPGHPRGPALWLGACWPPPRGLWDQTKLVGYREDSHLSPLGSESPQVRVGDASRDLAWGTDGVMARPGQHCLGVGVAPRSQAETGALHPAQPQHRSPPLLRSRPLPAALALEAPLPGHLRAACAHARPWLRPRYSTQSGCSARWLGSQVLAAGGRGPAQGLLFHVHFLGEPRALSLGSLHACCPPGTSLCCC